MKGREGRGTRTMENNLNRVRGYFIARAMMETNDAIDYFDTVSKIKGFVLS